MKFDSFTLAAVVQELKQTLVGGRVVQVAQPEAETLCLSVRREGDAAHLLLSASTDNPRAHLIADAPSARGTPPNFCALLRKLLRQAQVEEVQQLHFDRLLHLTLRGESEIGEARSFTLIGEFMGKHSNLVLVDEAGVIVAPIKPVSHRVNRYRELLPGRPYVAPPQGAKRNPLGLTAAAWPEVCASAPAQGPLQHWWRQVFLGASEDFWRVLCDYAGLDPAATVEGTPAWEEALWGGLTAIQALVSAGNYRPTLYRTRDGEPQRCYPVPLPAPEDWTAEPVASLSGGWEQVVAAARERARRLNWQQRLRQRVNQALTRTRRQRDRTAAALAQAGDAEAHQIRGELLLAHYQQIPRGQTSVAVPNYYDPDLKPITIDLDPQLGPAENAERYFAAAAKARRAQTHLPPRLAALEGEVAQWEALAARVEAAQQDAALQALEAEIEARLGPTPAAVPARTPARPKSRREDWLSRLERHVSADGYEIVVGKNAEQNGALLSYVAAPDDLWFHVRGAGSGHVLVRTEGHPERVPPTTLHEAAALAARHSSARHSALVPVSYTRRKYVTKVKGVGGGQVTYRHEKTLWVEPNES